MGVTSCGNYMHAGTLSSFMLHTISHQRAALSSDASWGHQCLEKHALQNVILPSYCTESSIIPHELNCTCTSSLKTGFCVLEGLLPVQQRRHQELMEALLGGERSDPAALFGSPQSVSPDTGTVQHLYYKPVPLFHCSSALRCAFSCTVLHAACLVKLSVSRIDRLVHSLKLACDSLETLTPPVPAMPDLHYGT